MAYTRSMLPLFLWAALVPTDIAPADGGPQVTLGPPAADVDTGMSPAVLKLASEAHNGLHWPVDSIAVGVLYGPDRHALEQVDPSRMYAAVPLAGPGSPVGQASSGNAPGASAGQASSGGAPLAGPGAQSGHSGAAPGAVGVLVQRVPVELAADGKAMALLRALLPEGTPIPNIFLSHVLGYTLADVDAATLFQLLDTNAAADEWAACATFGLVGLGAPAAASRAKARAQWAHHPALKGDLAAALLRPVDPKPTQAETFRRVFAARALGVLGGPSAEDTLSTWRESPELARFDSPLQVLRVGRASGSPFETPLAYAVPPSAQRMRDVVDVALEDARHLEAMAVALPVGGVQTPPITDPDPPWWTQPVAWAVLLGGLAAGGAAVAFWRRRVV